MISRQLSLFRSNAAGDLVAYNDKPVPSTEENLCIDAEGRLWSERERKAWAPPEDITVAEYAERHRMLSAKTSAAGTVAWTNKPYYTVEVMNAFASPYIERITIMASVQSSKTEAFYNMIAYAIDQDPAPTLVTMSSLKGVKKASRRIADMINLSPALAKHLTGNPDDVTSTEIDLANDMPIYFATAGSTSDLRNITVRYVFDDETDDYEEGLEGEGSPIELTEARATTFWNRKIITCSTVTTEDGYINIEYQRSNMSRYYVPCPHCHGYQVLSFWRIKCRGAELGRWPKEMRDPEYIKANRLARYECEHCGAEIDDRDKPEMLQLGTWMAGTKDDNGNWSPVQDIKVDGTCSIPRLESSHVGFWWNALYSPWRTFSDVAAQYFATKDDREKYKTFVNLWLAEPWKEVILTQTESEILKARCELSPQIVPAIAVALTCFVDCQKYGFWFLVRAWAQDYTSWNIHYGQLPTWEDVEKLLFETTYPIEGSDDRIMKIWRAGLDTGGGKGENYDASMTERAYIWLRRNMVGRGCRVWGTKGSSNPLSGKVQLGKPLDKLPSGKPLPPIPGIGGLQLVMLDTGKLKDTFHYRLREAIEGHPGGAYLHSNTCSVYTSHIMAEEKRKNKRGAVEWTKVANRNDLLDCECGNLALADPEWPGGGVNLIRSPMSIQKATDREISKPVPKVEVYNPYLGGRPNPFERRF
jgi:phage terminase large subunit GpA-like protein